MRRLHLRRGTCVLCGSAQDLNLHHVVPRRPHLGDDVEANLVFLCGSGIHGCHGAVEMNNSEALRRLREHLLTERPDTLEYIATKMGSRQLGDGWFDSAYPSGDSGTIPAVREHGGQQRFLPEPGLAGSEASGTPPRR